MPMASQLKTMWMMLVFLQYCVNGKPIVPCLFIFGDSTFDNGNNNNLHTAAKANYPPYGIDFPSGITGRFSNGRNSIDFIAEFLGFENYIPPFATARGEEILQGVNYASGAAGIRNETGQQQGDVISLDRQLKNHQTTMSYINQRLGNHILTSAYLSKCIYFVAIGGNDYLNNYFLPQFFPTSRLYTEQQYANVLGDQLSHQLTTLYNYGARKVVVFGPGPLASTPFELDSCRTKGSACLDNVNNAVGLYNDMVKSVVAHLNDNLKFSTFIYINITGIMSNSSVIGSMVTDVPCCDVSPTARAPAVQCTPFGNSCSNRKQYKFWDRVHPTDASYEVFAKEAYKTQSPSHAYPFNISYLTQL